EERETIETLNKNGDLGVAIDPLDGSSNIDCNVSIGTIFSIKKIKNKKYYMKPICIIPARSGSKRIKNKNINKTKALNFFKNNIKETKEHNMIVDMERNDLSRICIPGSVKLKKEKSVEEYKDLYHYVSLISGKLKKKVENIDIIKAMMPGGSVIGCPKISTLNLLNNQEKE
ncbi:MAG: chorismate-binding protein, partial [Candidatus Micropelagos thuwalensis]|nr:chorismate-binding protein [Candidatus Micropelagos thuwalensis]